MKSEKICILCAEKRRKYYTKNRDKIINKSNVYYKNNRTQRIDWQKQYGQKNKENIKCYNEQYYHKNRESIIKSNIQYAKDRKKKDPIFKLRKRVSGDIWKMLKTNNSSKNGSSIMKHLPYSIQELKEHLENQFEPWMSWSNWGSFHKNKWNDDNIDTWTWNIDHIIPHATFKYTNMNDEEFKRCWALSNLRPLNSKLNLQKNSRLI